MSVAGEIINDTLRRREGSFSVDDPFFSFQLEKGAVEMVRVGKLRARRRKRKNSIIFGLLEQAREDSAKNDSQSLEREEIAVFTRSPL